MGSDDRGVCLRSPLHPEYSMCGEAFDAFDSGDAAVPLAFAAEGTKVQKRLQGVGVWGGGSDLFQSPTTNLQSPSAGSRQICPAMRVVTKPSSARSSRLRRARHVALPVHWFYSDRRCRSDILCIEWRRLGVVLPAEVQMISPHDAPVLLSLNPVVESLAPRVGGHPVVSGSATDAIRERLGISREAPS